MAERREIPRNDQDEAVQSYQDRMTPLARLMSRWANRAVDAMRRETREMMERTSYSPDSSTVWANLPADAVTVNRLSELASLAPDSIRKSTMRTILSRIASGRLTMRSALEQIYRLEAYAFVDALRIDVAGLLVGVAEEGMYRGQFMLQKAAGVGWSFDELDDQRIVTFVGHRFTRSSAWRFLRPVQERASQELKQTIVNRETPGQLDARLGSIKDVTAWRAKRESRTTITEVSNDSHMEEYKGAGVKQFQFQATFDERTCPVCGQLDGKRFDVDKAEVGVNYPPMHPNCRCTTVAVLNPRIVAKMAPLQYKDRATGKVHEIPRDFTYQDWYKTFGPGRTDGVEYVPKKPKK